MKRYKNLWDIFVSVENLELAAKNAVKSKKNKKYIKFFLEHKDDLLKKLQSDLIDGKYRTSEYKIRTIYEPKKRDIYILPLFPDHIVHWGLINVLGPIWQSTFVHDSYACISGKGLHKASLRVMNFIRKYKYALQCDIRKFYPSIDHEIMFSIVKKKIADKQILSLLHDIIFSCGTSKNLPIGNLTSQWLGNVYLNEMDHFIKEQLHVRAYVRYCDDFILFGNNKSELHRLKNLIQSFLYDTLKLTFSKSSVYPIQQGITFIGYRHFRKFILIRKYCAQKIKKHVLNIVIHNDHSNKAIGQLAAFHGWLKWSCSFNLKMFIYQIIVQKYKIMKQFIQKHFKICSGLEM